MLKYRLIRKSKKIQLHQKYILSAVIEWKNGLVGCLIAQKEKRTMEGGEKGGERKKENERLTQC